MNDIPKCPKCGSEYTYFDGSLYVCPDCGHEFDSVEEAAEANDVARDSNGAELFDGQKIENIQIPQTIASFWGVYDFGDQSEFTYLGK